MCIHHLLFLAQGTSLANVATLMVKLWPKLIIASHSCYAIMIRRSFSTHAKTYDSSDRRELETAIESCQKVRLGREALDIDDFEQGTRLCPNDRARRYMASSCCEWKLRRAISRADTP